MEDTHELGDQQLLLTFKPGPLGIRVVDSEDGGVFITHLVKGASGPLQAKALGVQVGDRPLLINGIRIRKSSDLIENFKPELGATIVFLRSADKRSPHQATRSKYEVRIEAIRNILSSEVVDIAALREMSYDGIPEEFRSIVWQLLLKLLPPEKSQWEKRLMENRELYRSYCSEFILRDIDTDEFTFKHVHKSDLWHYDAQTEVKQPEEAKAESATFPPSVRSIAEDESYKFLLGEQAGGQVASSLTSWLTAPQKIDCFNSDDLVGEKEATVSEQTTFVEEEPAVAVEPPPVKPLALETAEDDPLRQDSESRFAQYFQEEVLWEQIEKDLVRTCPGLHFFTNQTYGSLGRVLFLYSKLNPGVSYVQGMNEVVAPLFWVFSNGKETERLTAESTSFFALFTVLAPMRDTFIQAMDRTTSGLQAMLAEMVKILSHVDPELAEHLRTLNIVPEFYGVRWLTALLARELSLPDTVRLWDALLAADNLRHRLLCCCCSLLFVLRGELLAMDFSQALKLLQEPAMADVERLLRVAARIEAGEVLVSKQTPGKWKTLLSKTNTAWKKQKGKMESAWSKKKEKLFRGANK